GWNAHDSIQYSNRGGVVFSVGAEEALTGGAASYLAQGEWTTYIEKLEGNRAYVKITKEKLKSLDFSTGTVIANVGKSFFSNSDSLFSYDFDLSNAKATQAYEAMLRGSLVEAQALSGEKEGGVTLDLTRQAESSGSTLHMFFGLPILLNISHSSGETTTFSNTTYHADQSKSRVEYGVYERETDTKAFFRHRNWTSAFSGVSYSNIAANGTEKDGEFGKVVLSYQNDHSNSSTLHQAMTNFMKETGLGDALAISAPQSVSGY